MDAPPGEWRRVHWLFTHRADLLAALVYGCLAYLSFSALSGYTNAHTLPNGQPLFPHPWGGYALAVAVDGAVLYAFISFKRAPRLAGVLLVSGAAATYTLQRWHAQGALHPLWVAGVVPGAMVLVTFAWHRIREAETDRPDWPVPQTPDPGEATPPAAPPGPATPDDDEPTPGPEVRPRTTQDAPRRERPVVRGRPNGTLSKADRQALYRAGRDPAKVEQVMVRRGLDRSLVAERWPLPSRNGNGERP